MADRIQATLGTSILAAMRSALLAVRGDQGGGPAEAARDAQAARLGLQGDLAAQEAILAETLSAGLLDALAQGWNAEAAAANEDLPAGINLAAADEDQAALAIWPIQGNTAGDIAAHLAGTWRFQADGLLGQAAASGQDGALPGNLADLANRTASQAGQAAVEAFHAGAGAARLAIPYALEKALARG
jgi:hypothetical protein